MEEFHLKEETYAIIGLCMEVHKILGKGHSENVYADALEYEFKRNAIPYEREKNILLNTRTLSCRDIIFRILLSLAQSSWK